MSEDHSTEIWKPIQDWEGIYSISNHGRVRRDKPGNNHTYVGKIMGLHMMSTGYYFADLWDGPRHKKRFIHHLVLEAFVGKKPSAKHQCNHKDGNKINNFSANLEWVTSKYNNWHAYHVLGKNQHHGEKGNAAKLTWPKVRRLRAMRKNGWLLRDLAAKFGLAIASVHDIVHEINWNPIHDPQNSGGPSRE